MKMKQAHAAQTKTFQASSAKVRLCNILNNLMRTHIKYWDSKRLSKDSCHHRDSAVLASGPSALMLPEEEERDVMRIRLFSVSLPQAPITVSSESLKPFCVK
ncbi:hypothetical protein ICNINCKA_01070 [Synechococcus sp. CBW1107]|nr:hypothetical protein ICNINCKA_01070 [Synechococcus sp. CBW1107]